MKMTKYNYDACDTCQLSTCVYDIDDMTEAEQESQCPAVINVSVIINGSTQPAINSIPWIAYRAEKLALIQSIIDEQGPVSLMELSNIANVPVRTLRSWQARFFDYETSLSAGIPNGAYRTIIKAVVENKGKRVAGRGVSRREDRANRVANILAEFGPLPLREMAEQADVPLETVRDWSKRNTVIKTDHYRAGGDFRPNKIICWVVGVRDG